MILDPNNASRAVALAALVEAFRRPVTSNGLLEIGRQLAVAFPRLEAEPCPPAYEVRARLVARMPAASQQASPTRAAIRMMVLMLDMVALGPGAAMERGLLEMIDAPDATLLLASCGRFLDATGLRQIPSDEELAGLGAALAVSNVDLDAPLAACLAFLGVSRATPYEARRRAFLSAVSALLETAVRGGRDDLALTVEQRLQTLYLKTVETLDHHAEASSVVEAAWSSRPFGAQPPQDPAVAQRRPRVGFLIFNGAMLAHTEVLLSFLAGLARLPDPPIEPVVFIYGVREGGELATRLDTMGVAWRTVGASGPHDWTNLYRHTREALAADRIDAAVFVSLTLHLAYFCRAPLAAVQIWWSLKFPLPNFEGLDGRVFYRSLFDRAIEFQGRTWRGGPLALSPPEAPPPEAVAEIRARYAGYRLLGTVAREEKIAEPSYLDAVVEVLKRHPDTCFLWTGRNALPEILQTFERGGVAERCHFIGWVPPAPYLMAFDLFIETYPLTGLMTGWSMAYGKPVISVGSMGFIGTHLAAIYEGLVPVPDADRRTLDDIFRPIDGRLPRPWAVDPSEIPAFADALLGDPTFAKTFGDCLQTFVDQCMADDAASAGIQARHFAEIVREKLGATDVASGEGGP